MRMLACLSCGEAYEVDSYGADALHNGARCPECYMEWQAQRPHSNVHNARTIERHKAYNSRAWQRLSRRARHYQPYCSDCGDSDPASLTTDHSVEAWDRIARGLSIDLRHVDVLCRPCTARA